MNDIATLPIIQTGTLYYIPVGQSMRSVTVEGFPFDSEPDHGQIRLVTTSGHDQFHSQEGDLHWVVVEVPALHNGEQRSMLEINYAIEYAYRHLHKQGLVPDQPTPVIVPMNPFKQIMAPSWS